MRLTYSRTVALASGAGYQSGFKKAVMHHVAINGFPRGCDDLLRYWVGSMRVEGLSWRAIQQHCERAAGVQFAEHVPRYWSIYRRYCALDIRWAKERLRSKDQSKLLP